MKRLISINILVVLLLFVYSFFPAYGQKGKGPYIQFQSASHDFGNIKLHSKATFKFTFTNTGDEVLVLSDVKTTCGCTVPEWPKEPVLPAGKGTITISYEADETGAFSKTIKILSNASISMVELTISGNVIE